jgi:4-amino-4-deoxy-L-arabinose transferase-like glycosyltransferase
MYRDDMDTAEPDIAPQPGEGADSPADSEQPPAGHRATVPAEPRSSRALYLALALAVTAGFWFFLTSMLAPAPGRPGIDENAYLLAGKNIAQHFTTGFKPADDYQYVSAMWLRTEDGWYYPKYPFGLPLLNAVPVLLGHREWAFGISALCTSLAALGMFFLARDIVGSFYALLAMIVLAMGPTTLQLANLPNSHAPALCVVVWGMFLLMRWWTSGRWWLGVAAGLLLGFAVTIRYTEALLLFPLYSLNVMRADDYINPKVMSVLKVLGFLPVGPIGIAVLSRIAWKDWRSYVAAGVPIFAWAVPVGALVILNWFTIGDLTGYDSTNESSGFSLDHFFSKWDFSVHQVYVYGLFMLAPLGVAGLIVMCRGAGRTALMLTLWFVPGMILYTSYYWGENFPTIAFLRFLLTLLPPLIVAAMWLLRSTAGGETRSSVAPLSAGLLAAVAASVGLWSSLPEIERQHRGNLNLHYSAQRLLSHVKPAAQRPMILADSGMFPQFLQYMQFMYDADWYAGDVFGVRAGGGFGLAGVFQQLSTANPKSPAVLQRHRMEHIDAFRKGKTDDDFIREQHRLMDEALAAGRRVYAVLSPGDAHTFRRRSITSAYDMVQLERWVEPCTIRYPRFGERNWLALSVWNDDEITPWRPQTRLMFEIRRVPATQPTASR